MELAAELERVLAEVCAAGSAEATYRSHESGKRQLTIAASKRYARLLERSWEWLMFGDAFPYS